MRLLLLRHAQSEGNRTGNYSTAVSDSLSELGWRQARAFAEAFDGGDIERVYCSPLTRAYCTIAPWLRARGRTAIMVPEFAEACWHEERTPGPGDWRPTPITLLPEWADRFVPHRDAFVRPADPETYAQGLARVHASEAMIRGWAAHGARSVLIATHGHWLRELLCRLLDRPGEAFDHANCRMTELVFEHGRARLLRTDCHADRP